MVLYRFSSIVYLAVNIRLSNMYDGLVNENLSVIAVEGVALTSTNSKSSTVKWFSHCSSDPLLPVPHYIFGSRDKPIRLCCDRIWGMNLFYLKQSDQSPDRIGKKTVLVQESQSYIRSLRFCNSISSWCRCSIERFQQKNIQFSICNFRIFYLAACVEILRALDDGDVKERLSRAREAAGSDMVRVMREVFPIVTQVKIN